MTNDKLKLANSLYKFLVLQYTRIIEIIKKPIQECMYFCFLYQRKLRSAKCIFRSSSPVHFSFESDSFTPVLDPPMTTQVN